MRKNVTKFVSHLYAHSVLLYMEVQAPQIMNLSKPFEQMRSFDQRWRIILIFYAAFLMVVIISPALMASEASMELRLEHLIEEALENNPKLLGTRAGARSVKFEANAEVPFIKAPEVILGSRLEQPFKWDGKLEQSIKIKQKIPFPTKSLSQRRAFVQKASVAKNQVLDFERDLVRRLKAEFFKYLEVHEKKKLLKELIQILRKHAQKLESNALQSQEMKSHVLRAKNDIELLRNEMTSLQASESILSAKINGLVGRKTQSILGVPVAPPMGELPPGLNNTDLKETLPKHPRYQRWVAEVRAAEAKRSSARSEWLPDIMLSYRYNDRKDQLPDHSEVMVGLSLPFAAFWKTSAQNKRSQALLESARANQVNEIQALEIELIEVKENLRRLYNQLKNFELKIIPQAKERIQIVMRLSPTDMATIHEHQGVLESYIRIQIEYLEKRTAFELTMADLQYILPELSHSNSKPKEIVQ